MKVLEKDYVPETVKFVLPENSELPEVLGGFDCLESCQDAVNKTFTATQIRYTATRYMDAYEKDCTRKEYAEELEIIQPELFEKLNEARQKYEEAKRNLKEAEEQISASDTKVKDLAKTVRIGTKEIKLDMISTWQVPVGDKYYILTYRNGYLKVAGIISIPEHEKRDLYNTLNKNREAVEKLQNEFSRAI